MSTSQVSHVHAQTNFSHNGSRLFHSHLKITVFPKSTRCRWVQAWRISLFFGVCIMLRVWDQVMGPTIVTFRRRIKTPIKWWRISLSSYSSSPPPLWLFTRRFHSSSLVEAVQLFQDLSRLCGPFRLCSIIHSYPVGRGCPFPRDKGLRHEADHS
jgi:hypothetical protein